MIAKRLTSLCVCSVLRRSYGSEVKYVTNEPGEVFAKQRLFASLKPTVNLNLSTYLGVVRNFEEIQNAQEDTLFCITDMNSITVAQDPRTLRENIFRTAASLLACGIDPGHTTLFVQSAVKEHCELYWILGLISSIAKLGDQPIYIEKLRQYHEVELGVFTYPVMQATDILLYKSTQVAVPEDQIPHVYFTQSLAKSFNDCYGLTFPYFTAIFVKKVDAGGLKSLTDSSKKLSNCKGDLSLLININDDPHEIIRKINATAIDNNCDIGYVRDKSVGISNLINIHAIIAGKTAMEIVSEASYLDTQQYKKLFADVLIEHLTPIRRNLRDNLARRDELTFQLDAAATKAHFIAAETIAEVKQKMGLGARMSAVRRVDIAEKSRSNKKAIPFLNKSL